MNNIAVITQESHELVVARIVKVLKNSGLVVIPTETRYGLIVNASDKAALEKLYKTKQRPSFMPTAIFVNSVDEVFQYGKTTKTARRLANAFLPGPLTMILQAKTKMEKYVVHENKIGIRYSSSKLIADLLTRVDFPLSATSANISGKNECESIEEIKNEFGDAVDLYIDGGILTNEASTVVDVSEKQLCFHRLGAITKEEIILKSES